MRQTGPWEGPGRSKSETTQDTRHGGGVTVSRRIAVPGGAVVSGGSGTGPEFGLGFRNQSSVEVSLDFRDPPLSKRLGVSGVPGVFKRGTSRQTPARGDHPDSAQTRTRGRRRRWVSTSRTSGPGMSGVGSERETESPGSQSQPQSKGGSLFGSPGRITDTGCPQFGVHVRSCTWSYRKQGSGGYGRWWSQASSPSGVPRLCHPSEVGWGSGHGGWTDVTGEPSAGGGGDGLPPTGLKTPAQDVWGPSRNVTRSERG